ncbi:MAG: hypothetical protein Q9184_000604, partial [Pyrenodesmia sp. 2 TL-2023]
MSLFGSSPPEEPTQSTRSGKSQSLFDDDNAAAAGNSSIFDDGDGSGPSPWEMPTPKKAAKGDMVKTLLPAPSVPESYIDAFDTVLDSGYRSGSGTITVAGAKKLFEGSGVNADEQARIINIVTGGHESSQALGRNEFNVLVALIGLAQEHDETTLDGVDERRKNLPEPSLPAIQHMRTAKVSENTESSSPSSRETPAPPKQSSPEEAPSKSRQLRKDSLENLDADPWGSPALHKGHAHTASVQNEATPSANETTAIRPLGGAAAGARTTSAFTTHSEVLESTSSTLANEDTSAGQTDGGTAGWVSFGNPGQGGLGSGGFGSSGDDQGNHAGVTGSRSLGGGRTHRHIEESVTVNLLPEKEGMFMFQHRNYEVKSARRGSTVIRRYSDFVWLLDCLHKRYPFRLLPLLPPKRVAVNGRHLATNDSNFIEKRRRGLVRFTNALVRHPVLGQEELVKMFLTVPTELAGLRKQVSNSVQEEFVGRQLPPDLEDSLPTNLTDTFDTVRSG